MIYIKNEHILLTYDSITMCQISCGSSHYQNVVTYVAKFHNYDLFTMRTPELLRKEFRFNRNCRIPVSPEPNIPVILLQINNRSASKTLIS